MLKFQRRTLHTWRVTWRGGTRFACHPLAAWRRGFAAVYRQQLMDGTEEVLTQAEKKDKDDIIKELTRKLSGPLADENGNVPTGEDRPIAIEVDGPSHFYANSRQYTAYTKLKHRLLTKMGYKVLHVPYFEWRQLRSAKDREDYMKSKLQEEPSEWLDPEDEKYYNSQEWEEFSVKPEVSDTKAAGGPWPDTPCPPAAPSGAPKATETPPTPPPPPQTQPPPPPFPNFPPPPKDK